jgi:type VI protein secretion system component Hcp
VSHLVWLPAEAFGDNFLDALFTGFWEQPARGGHKMSDNKYYLRMWGLKGESDAAGHHGDHDVDRWSIYNARRTQSTGGSSNEKLGNWTRMSGRDFGLLEITKRYDSTSASIYRAAMSGRRFDWVILFVEKASGSGPGGVLYTLMLENALVSTFNMFEDPTTQGMFSVFSLDSKEVLFKYAH